jgi:hypothetical protein
MDRTYDIDDQDGIRERRIRRLKKTRGGILADITKRRKEITKLFTDDPSNLEVVELKMLRFYASLRKFEDAHDSYNAELLDEEEQTKSYNYYIEVDIRLYYFIQQVSISISFIPL